ncbi:MAG TPA: two-component system sensor histidine kinase NtrB [Candidatus Brocadiia bacterium]|nr:PAS domain-containing protein [Planctomycetota bacterium]MBI4008110.1 PAS domain-containing protein [Planctomycetota bacterium]MDO8092233.1 ATP-binding protein [Candidatus Brocadiales bacterium]
MVKEMTMKEQMQEDDGHTQNQQVGTGQDFKAELAAAFNLFNQSTQKLELAYMQLQERVKEIDNEMELTNERLKRKVEELDSLTRYLNNILESMHSGVVAIDLNGKITTLNRAAEEILNISATEVRGKDCQSVIRNVSAGPPLLLKALRDGKNYLDVEHEILTKDDKARLVESSISMLKDISENIVGAVEIFRDVTEIRDLKERLHRADKLATIGEMAATIAHEIRNPLNGIEGFASLLERDFNNGDPRRRLVQSIINGTKSLNKTITDLLIFARPVKLNLVDANISEILDNAVYFATMEMKQKGIKSIRICRNFNAHIANIPCDPEQLQQVFLNLLLNAIQAMPEGGDITVSSDWGIQNAEGKKEKTPIPQSAHRKDGGSSTIRNPQFDVVQIGIADTGIGIRDDVKARIFDPFFTTKPDGTGLGLSIAHKIVELHAGWITVQSKLQKGTIFLVNLPVRVQEFKSSKVSGALELLNP